MEEEAYRCGGWMRIYRISSRRQPKKGGPPAWGLGGERRSPHLKKQNVTKCSKGLWEVHTTFWLGSLKRGDRWEDLGIDERITLRWILGK
jgi:hypothetical protein